MLRRVRVVVSVAEGEVDQCRLRSVVERKGWHLSDGVSSNAGSGRRHQVIEVFLRGSEYLARRAAIREVMRLAKAQAIDVTIQSASFVPSPVAPRMYRLYRAPTSVARWKWLTRLSIALGQYDTGRSVSLAADESVIEAEDRLNASDDLAEAGEGALRLRPHGLLHDRTGQVDEPAIAEGRRAQLAVCGVVAAMVAMDVGGAVLVSTRSEALWLTAVVAVLPLAGLALLLMSFVALPISTMRRNTYLVLLVGQALGFSWLWATQGSLVAFVLVATPVGILGLRLLFTGVSAGVVVSWAVPLFVTVGVAGLPGVSGLHHRIYLLSFGIDDAGALPIHVFWRVWPSMVTVLGGWLVVALVMCPLGYARYLHMPEPVVRFSAVLMLPVALLSGAVFFFDTLLQARERAAGNQDLMAQGVLPDAYLGVDASFVRVHPRVRDPAHFGCRPRSDRDLVTFGTTGERIYLWDPHTRVTCQVRLGDYSFDVRRGQADLQLSGS